MVAFGLAIPGVAAPAPHYASEYDSARQDGGKSNWAEVAIGQAALGVLWVVSSGVISPWMVGGRSSAIGSTCM